MGVISITKEKLNITDDPLDHSIGKKLHLLIVHNIPNKLPFIMLINHQKNQYIHKRLYIINRNQLNNNKKPKPKSPNLLPKTLIIFYF